MLCSPPIEAPTLLIVCMFLKLTLSYQTTSATDNLVFVFHYYHYFVSMHIERVIYTKTARVVSILSLVFNYLPAVTICSTLDKWEELNINPERNGNRKWKLERRRSSKNSSNEFLWWASLFAYLFVLSGDCQEYL